MRMNSYVFDHIRLDEDWDAIRLRLIRFSYVLSELASRIRIKYEISLTSDGSTNWKDILLDKHFDDLRPYLEKWKYFETKAEDESDDAKTERGMRAIIAMQEYERYEIPEIVKLSSELRVNEEYLRVFILYNNVTKKVSGPAAIENYLDVETIRRPGSYIRLQDIDNYGELKKLYDLYKIRLSDEQVKTIRYKRSGRKVVSSEDTWKINVYMHLQEKLRYVTNPDNQRGLLRKYDGKIPRILECAIDEFVEDAVLDSDVEEDMEEFLAKTTKTKIRDAYKDVIDRYRLPNIKDIKHLVRLIGC